MSKNIQKQIIFWLSFMLWMGTYVQQGYGEKMKSSPEYGDGVVYYDINDRGELLEIDYGRQQGRILGKIDWNSDYPLLLLEGWVLNGQYVYLLNTEQGFWARLYLYSLEHAALQKTSILMDLAGDSAFLPISATTNYIQYIDSNTRKTQRFVLDASNNAVKDIFAFDLRIDSIHVMSDNETRMFLGYPWGFQLFEIDITQNKIVSEQDAAHIVSSDSKNERAFVTAFHNNCILITKTFLKEKSKKLYLANLSDMQVFAESKQIPFFNGKCYIDGDARTTLRISCVVETVEKSRLKPTGTIQRFVVQNDKILPIESVEFDPETEIPLRESNEEFNIFPKYSFDYLSLLTIRRKVFSQLPGRFTPESIPFAKELIHQIQEEFYANSDQEQRIPLELIE